MFYGYGILNNHVPTLKATVMKGGSVLDTDAQAFITAASITDATQKNAVNQLVLDFKTANIWTKFKAIYPFVGGTAAQHRFNLKSPGTTNADFYLDFFGGGTHSANGYLPNGASYADTKLAPNVMSQNSIHISYYSRTNISGLYIDMGSEDASSYCEFLPAYNGGGGIVAYAYINTKSSDVSSIDYPTTGLLIGNRTSSTSNVLYRNTSKIINGTKSSLPPSAKNIYLGASNYNGTAGAYSVRQQAFASIGDGLTDSEATAFYTAVQAYQTTLGRQV